MFYELDFKHQALGLMKIKSKEELSSEENQVTILWMVYDDKYAGDK